MESVFVFGLKRLADLNSIPESVLGEEESFPVY